MGKADRLPFPSLFQRRTVKPSGVYYCIYIYIYGCFQNSGTPKWMVYTGKPYFLMDDLGGPPLFLETTIYET